MCGEEESNLDEYVTWLGSPPHVRGRAAVAGAMVLMLGITPACAGKSISLPVSMLG